ncbi:MAG: ComF family protein [Planctomycetota bacterium]
MRFEPFFWRAIDELAPPRCRLCGVPAPDDAACRWHSVPRDDAARCGRCALRLPPGAVDGTRCWRCRGRAPAQASLRVVGDYGEPLRSWILAWKHGARRELTAVLAALLVEAGERRPRARPTQRGQQATGDRPLLVPVPAHPLRQLERGHAGVEQLARDYGRLVGQVAVRALRRRRATPPQGEPGATSRRANVAEAFALRRPVQNRRVLLIDDVVTTGATIDEAARVLRRAGAVRVDALALARAEVSSGAS